jgi:hypothetical protein
MTPLTCTDVDDRLPLYAAGECAAPEAAAIGRHLARCPRCAAALGEARHLLALLDLRLQEPERLRRLEDRLAAEGRPRRAVLRFPAAVRRAASLAAMLLLTVALSGWLLPGLRPGEVGDGGLAVALRAADQRLAPGGVERSGGPLAKLAAPGGPGLTPEQYRDQLQAAETTGRLPSPPAVDLVLELRNTAATDLKVWVAGPLTRLRLDLKGPGAVNVPAPEGAEGEVEPRAVVLKPGATYPVRIRRLADRRGGSARFWYWTEPGEYTLTARFTTAVAPAPPGAPVVFTEGGRRFGAVTLRSPPVTTRVEGK